MGFTNEQVPDQHGRTILDTGANTGIGFETAKLIRNRERYGMDRAGEPAGRCGAPRLAAPAHRRAHFRV